MLTHRYEEALVLAHAWHRSQKRKGSDVPYLAHLLSVSALVLEHGGTEDEAIAGLLHDALEDAPTQEEADARRGEIRHRFGSAVLSIVEACTDAEPMGKGFERALDGDARRDAWRRRKSDYVAHVGEAPGPVLMVAAADKVHNAGAIARDVRTGGEGVFSRFVGLREGTLWYYHAVHAALARRVADEPRIRGLIRELSRSVAEMEGPAS